MSTTYTWQINTLDRETSDGYVFTAHYSISAQNDVYSSGAYGSIGFERPEGELIPFSELTSSLCIEWVKNALTEEKVEAIELALQQQLDEQAAPTTASGLPWVNQNQ